MKYLFITLEIQDGEREHTHRVLETTNCKNINFAAEYYAAHYWGYSENDNGVWYAHGGEIAIEFVKVIELSEFEFNLMHKIFYSDKDRDNYFNIVHAGHKPKSKREQIQIQTGENGNILITKKDDGFVIDVFGISDQMKRMSVNESNLTKGFEEDMIPENHDEIAFTKDEIETFKEEWGQSHEEICAALDLDEEDAGAVLTSDYFWLHKDKKWYPKFSSMYSEKEQEIADYLRPY